MCLVFMYVLPYKLFSPSSCLTIISYCVLAGVWAPVTEEQNWRLNVVLFTFFGWTRASQNTELLSMENTNIIYGVEGGEGGGNEIVSSWPESK